MAKITKPGMILPISLPWPCGCAASCPGCLCEWTIEEDDKCRNHVTERRLNGRSSIELVCPNCGDWIKHESSRTVGSSAGVV